MHHSLAIQEFERMASVAPEIARMLTAAPELARIAETHDAVLRNPTLLRVLHHASTLPEAIPQLGLGHAHDIAELQNRLRLAQLIVGELAVIQHALPDLYGASSEVRSLIDHAEAFGIIHNRPWLEILAPNGTGQLASRLIVADATRMAIFRYLERHGERPKQRIQIQEPRQEDILVTLLTLRASERVPISAKKIADQSRRSSSPVSSGLVKKHAAILVRKGLLESKAGRSGGYWLTDAGRARARSFRRRR